MTPLTLQNVAKAFRQGNQSILAVNNVSLTVNPGEFLAIMGPSGSGKSTLLHLMAGLTTPSSGNVLVNNQNLALLNDSQLTLFRRNQIGLVFQAYNLVPTLNALDNILLPALPCPSLSSRVDQLLNQLSLAPRKLHKPDALSGGEQQRVAIARALVNQPAVILADEPTGSLDSTTGQALCKLLRSLCDSEKRTIILVTHEPAVACHASRVAVLKDGKLVADFPNSHIGDPQALHSAYQNALCSSSQN